MSAWVATELTEPAGIKSEALAGGYVYLGDKTAALVLGVVRDQILGLVAQDLAALGLESLVGMKFVQYALKLMPVTSGDVPDGQQD